MRVLVVLLLLGGGGVARAETYTNETYGLTLPIPDGYVRTDDAMLGKAIVGYARGKLGVAPYTLLGVSSLGGTIGQEAFDPTPIATQVAAALGAKLSHVEVRKLAWHGFTLDAFVGTLQADDQRIAIAGVQVPLRRAALQVTMLSSASDRELGDELATIVGTLDGDTNWATPVTEADERGFGMMFAVGAGILAVLLVVAHFVSRRKP